MYTFVLEWTPALSPSEPPANVAKDTNDDADGDGHVGSIPHGYIFAAFMVRGSRVMEISAHEQCFISYQ